jgi:hypothetical protein
VCTSCKDASSCDCKSDDCSAGQGQSCAKCGHESSLLPLPATPSEPMPPGGLMMDESVRVVIETYRERQRAQWAVAAATAGFRFAPPPPYYDDLLVMARKLIAEPRGQRDHEHAVILAQTAAELIGDQVLERLIETKGLSGLRRFLRRGKHPTSNLADDRVLGLYVELSGGSHPRPNCVLASISATRQTP